MPWDIQITKENNLPTGFAVPWVVRVYIAPVGGAPEPEQPRQRLKFPRYVPDSVVDGKVVTAAEAFIIWRKKYINYLIDEVSRGIARSELCQEIVNNIEGPAARILLQTALTALLGNTLM